MKQSQFVAIIILLLLVGTIIITSYTVLNKETEQTINKKFYVGVTYCGNSIQEAKELIDKVKDYTNLFVLQSGSMMTDSTTMNEIGDYVCASNLNYAVSGSTRNQHWIHNWLIEAKEKWGEQFIGIYYTDEPGGNMLDGLISPLENTGYQPDTGGQILTVTQIDKGRSGEINVYYAEFMTNYTMLTQTTTRYFTDGNITITKIYSTEISEQEPDSSPEKNSFSNNTTEDLYKEHRHTDVITYYPNGTITIRETTTTVYRSPQGGSLSPTGEYISTFYTSEKNITQYSLPIQPYEQVLKQNPIQTHDDVAEAFVNRNQKLLEDINKTQINEKSMVVFTADYGLYWWDYKGNFDVILAQLGWNHTVAQDIGLVRGAANMQGKSWGTIITWQYTHPPYLTNGKEMFEQMKTSYQTGAQYVIIFNYSEDKENPNTLQEEHFQALERFWNDVVQNPKIKHGNIKAEAALVLPQNYGWGMRHIDDNIWGIWRPDNISQQIWNQLQNKLDKYGLKLDIVFEDQNYQVTEKYSKIYYWNQK